MIYLVAFLVACTAALFTGLVVELVPVRSRTITRRLAEVEEISASPFSAPRRRERQRRRAQLEALFRRIGDWRGEAADASATRSLLFQAGFRAPEAVVIYRGVRVAVPTALAGLGLLMTVLTQGRGFTMALSLALLGWTLPPFFVRARAQRRRKELQKALPDALDALVVCVEAGLGLNQAIARVAEEVRHISVLMSEELAMVNLEIRAGTSREEALRNLAYRTGLPDVRSLVTMLVQTDRFGTSIAQALRVQSDTVREKRRQRAEEAAAKTAIKMLFPLVFLIFPAMFVITLGPAVIQLIEGWSSRPIP